MSMKGSIFFVLTFATVLVLSAQGIKPKDKSAILEIMASQEMSWNKGDLEGFMNGYWLSDSLRFIGKSGITYGWQPTLANYQRSYPDKAAMGKLKFTILRVESRVHGCSRAKKMRHKAISHCFGVKSTANG